MYILYAYLYICTYVDVLIVFLFFLYSKHYDLIVRDSYTHVNKDLNKREDSFFFFIFFLPEQERVNTW